MNDLCPAFPQKVGPSSELRAKSGTNSRSVSNVPQIRTEFTAILQPLRSFVASYRCLEVVHNEKQRLDGFSVRCHDSTGAREGTGSSGSAGDTALLTCFPSKMASAFVLCISSKYVGDSSLVHARLVPLPPSRFSLVKWRWKCLI